MKLPRGLLPIAFSHFSRYQISKIALIHFPAASFLIESHYSFEFCINYLILLSFLISRLWISHKCARYCGSIFPGVYFPNS